MSTTQRSNKKMRKKEGNRKKKANATGFQGLKRLNQTLYFVDSLCPDISSFATISISPPFTVQIYPCSLFSIFHKYPCIWKLVVSGNLFLKQVDTKDWCQQWWQRWWESAYYPLVWSKLSKFSILAKRYICQDKY